MARPISLPPCPSFRQPPPRSEGILRPIKGVRRDRSRPVPNVYPRGFVSPPHVRPRHRYSGACTGMTSKGENQSTQKSEGLWFQNGSKPYMRPLGMTCGYSFAPQVQRRRFPLTPCYMRGCLFPPGDAVPRKKNADAPASQRPGDGLGFPLDPAMDSAGWVSCGGSPRTPSGPEGSSGKWILPGATRAPGRSTPSQDPRVAHGTWGSFMAKILRMDS